MTLADLMAVIRARTLQVGRDAIVLAWRSAYYRRVKDMPNLGDELDDYQAEHEAAWSRGAGDDVDEHGRMSEARAARVWAKLRTGFEAWNTKLAGAGA
jgi:hypothetical protein